ncbi:YuzB family protein [Fervidibacillus halotolerans]|uniref:YuzB family protein n=1 Tax=Fervidibacillus halotolerans TaxID=2980027 RepID=A0A9E8LY43_9BACI|nr:YuzB family protein [Fervidibacillus halotolerans]WAA11888.1 YuzB family protein [Fervidibacillus halotolerans]
MLNDMVEFCISNLARGSYKALEQLEQDPDLDIIEYDCLSHCTLCERSLFALVNGEVVKGENAEELVENIYKHLEENPMF